MVTTTHVWRIIVAMYVSIYHLPCICCTLVPKICVQSEYMKHDRLSLKHDRLSYMKHSCHLSWHPNSKDQNYSLSVVKIVNKDRYSRWMCKHFWAYWDSRAVLAQQLAIMPVWNWLLGLCETTYGTAVLWHSCQHRHNIELTTVTACSLLNFEPYNAETSLALLAHIVCKSR